jgi:ParB family chromosome partitioning protein
MRVEKAVQELAQSIKEKGLLQAIQLVPVEGRFRIVFGDRRFLAHKFLGKKTILARIVEQDEKSEAIDRAIENIQRSNLSPLEEGLQYELLIKTKGFPIEKLQKITGKKASTIHRRLGILRMPKEFQKVLHEGKQSVAVVEEIWSCPDASYRDYLLEMAVDHGVTAVVARQWVQDFKKEERQKSFLNEEGGGIQNPMESQPIYRSCDVCSGPCKLSETSQLTICPTCVSLVMAVKEHVKEEKQGDN